MGVHFGQCGGADDRSVDTAVALSVLLIGVAAADLRFLIDGARICGDQTPADIGMEDDDQIDCMCALRGC